MTIAPSHLQLCLAGYAVNSHLTDWLPKAIVQANRSRFISVAPAMRTIQPPDFDFGRLIEQHIHPLIERDPLNSAMKGKQVAPQISAHIEQDYSGCLN